jgi:Protein of unknown function (DUF3300)
MIPGSAFFKQWAQTKMPNPIFWARVSLSLTTATLMTGLMFAGSGKLLAQDVPPPPPDAQDQQQAPQDNQQLPQYGAPLPEEQNASQNSYHQQDQGSYPQQQQQMPAPVGQPLTADQLNQLVAPIALYPDALIAQILAASTYPTQVVEADHWVQAQGNAPADQIAANANAQPWDPSVKALTAFPSVLAQMDRNMQWTTDLGNAYYNQPQDVMDAVQQMRQRAQQAGSLESTQQQTVSNNDGEIAIAPANPEVVYVPAYNPWVVYGPPVVAFPGYYYAPPPGLFFGVGFGFGMGFGWGIPVRPWVPWGWGWHSWGVGWYNRTVIYNQTTYITRSTTVINRGFNRPGAPPVQLAGQRGSFMNRPAYAGYASHVAAGARPVPTNGFVNRPGYNAPGNFNNRPVVQPGYNNNRVVQQPGYNNHVLPPVYNDRMQPGYNRPAPPPNGYVNGSRPAPPVSGNFPQRPTYTPAPTYTRQAPSMPTYHPSAPQNNSRPAPAPQPHPMSSPHAAPAPHGGGGGDQRH